jgi:hypothetical protein
MRLGFREFYSHSQLYNSAGNIQEAGLVLVVERNELFRRARCTVTLTGEENEKDSDDGSRRLRGCGSSGRHRRCSHEFAESKSNKTEQLERAEEV